MQMDTGKVMRVYSIRVFCFAWAGILLTVGGWLLIVLLNVIGPSGERLRSVTDYAPIVLWSLGFVSGGVAFVLALRGGAFREKSIAIMAIVFSMMTFLIAAIVPLANHLLYTPLRVSQCKENLEMLGERLLEYTMRNEDDILLGQEWCDILLSQDGLGDDSFLCQTSLAKSGQSSYALNKAIIGKSLKAVRKETVFMFESVPGWNACGGAESLTYGNHRLFFGHRANVMLVNGAVLTVTKKEAEQLCWN